MSKFVGTRAQGLAAMQAFAPSTGQRYAKGRNDDNGRAIIRMSRCCRPIVVAA